MITISDPKECSGCSSCVERCPKHCITFDEDNEGFRYPKVDVSKCVECGLCEKVCPVINGNDTQPITKVLAAINNDIEVRLDSSSGGIFSAIATDVINKGGVVFGAAYTPEWEVGHQYAETFEELTKFRGSKYMQSVIGQSYSQAEGFLKGGKIVLFSGTPCQIAGLKQFLRKEYDNLMTIDIICHGVPSAKVWRKYLAQLEKGHVISSDIRSVNFRSKRPGWRESKVEIISDGGKYEASKEEDAYFEAFIRNVILRPICYECPFKEGRNGSDMTIADFWGIQDIDSSMDDDRGTSMVILHNDRISLPKTLVTKSENRDSFISHNGSYFHSANYNGNRRLFFDKLNKSDDIIRLMRRCSRPSKTQRIQNLIYRKLHK